MSNLAIGALIDAVRARTSRERAKTDVARWLTHHATVERKLPPLPEGGETSPDLGLLYALATSSANSGGETGGGANAGASASGTGGGQPATTSAANSAAERPAANASGSTAASAGPALGGTSAGAAGPVGGGAVGSAGPQGGLIRAIPWGKLLTYAALALGGGGAASLGGAVVGHWLDNREEMSEAPSAAEYPLLDWLREQGHHLPTENAPDAPAEN